MSRGREKTLDFQPLYSGSSANVFKTVEVGKAAAGATLDTDFAALPAEDAARFRTILTTPPLASHPFVAHPRVPAAVREAIAIALLSIGADPANREFLAVIRLADPVRADYARDYRSLEAVDVRGLSGASGK